MTMTDDSKNKFSSMNEFEKLSGTRRNTLLNIELGNQSVKRSQIYSNGFIMKTYDFLTQDEAEEVSSAIY
jgi:hypothetical protein